MRLLLLAALSCLCLQPALAFDRKAVVRCFEGEAKERVREKCMVPTLKCDESDEVLSCLNSVEQQWFHLGMQYYRVASPIARANAELRAAVDCKHNEKCLGLSFLSLGPPQNASFATDIFEKRDGILADCEAKNANAGAEVVAQCSAERVAAFAAFNILSVSKDLKRLDEAVLELSQ